MSLNVEVVYALPAEQPLLKVQLAEGATVEDAIRASGVLEALLTPVFGHITNTFVDAFVNRADEIYAA